jgi:hypothetical protein
MLVPADMYTVQRDHCLAAIHADHGLVALGADFVSLRHEGERVTREIQVIVAGDEVLEEGRARFIIQFDGIVRAAADHTVLADTGLHEGQAGVPAGKLRGMRATEQRRMTVHMSVVQNALRRAMRDAGGAVARLACGAVSADRRGLRTGYRHMAAGHDFPGRVAGRFNDFKRAAVNRGRTERARYGSLACLVDGVDARTTDLDRVMTRDAMLADCAAHAKCERIVTAADDDLANAGDVDPVGTIAGDNRTITKNGYVCLAAARNAYGGAHWRSPLIRRLRREYLSLFARPENSWLATAAGHIGALEQNVTKVIIRSQSTFDLITINLWIFFAACYRARALC